MLVKRNLIAAALVVIVALGAILFVRSSLFTRLMQRIQGKKTVAQRLAQYGETARGRLCPAFDRAGLDYPPYQVVLVVLKQERKLQVYAAPRAGKMRFVKSYPVLAASGHLGPKLAEGDGQVPEGIYHVTFLNANSLYHLSMRLDYPNDFDRAMAARDGRCKLGQDIMIHGDRVSIGCIAVGNEASEDLFVLAADVGIRNTRVIISPVDFRLKNATMLDSNLPKWTGRLYEGLSREVRSLPVPHTP